MRKIKRIEKIKTWYKDDFRLEDLKKYSQKNCQELMENVYRANQKKINNKGTWKLKLGQ